MATSDLRERLVQRMGVVFNIATTLMLNELREAAPLGETGETRRGLAVVPGGSLTSPTATVVSQGPGGDFVEHGTRPHEIRPRSARVLRFVGGAGRIGTASPNQRIATQAGGVVFTAHVNHPGTPARPWFGPVVERWTEFLERASASIG